jgi:hypothetical protein
MSGLRESGHGWTTSECNALGRCPEGRRCRLASRTWSPPPGRSPASSPAPLCSSSSHRPRPKTRRGPKRPSPWLSRRIKSLRPVQPRRRKSGIGPGSPTALPTIIVNDNRGSPICKLSGGRGALPLVGSLSRGRLASAIEIANRLAASRSGADSRGMDTGSSRYHREPTAHRRVTTFAVAVE